MLLHIDDVNYLKLFFCSGHLRLTVYVSDRIYKLSHPNKLQLEHESWENKISQQPAAVRMFSTSLICSLSRVLTWRDSFRSTHWPQCSHTHSIPWLGHKKTRSRTIRTFQHWPNVLQGAEATPKAADIQVQIDAFCKNKIQHDNNLPLYAVKNGQKTSESANTISNIENQLGHKPEIFTP